MNKPVYQPTIHLKLVEEGMQLPVIDIDCASDERLEVRELCLRSLLTLPASELSIYRHTLIFDGKSYRILDKLAG
ncbi:MAG: hypothetical protein WCK63_12000 [Betaproteobacteria bacterium]